MKDKIYYYDRHGVLKLTLNKYPYYSEPGDLKNWSWAFDQQYGKINNFRRSMEQHELVIGIAGDYKTQHDALCDIFSADVISGEPGTLVLRGWKLQCYIIEASYEYSGLYDRKAKFIVQAVNPAWIRTNTLTFSGAPSGGSEDTDLGRDYSNTGGVLGRGYNYGYSIVDNHYASIDLPGIGNGYEIMIYGPQVDPEIFLNGNPIKVNVTIDATERLRIVSNGDTKTIKILSASGTETDAFIYRDKDNSPFMTLGEHTDLTYGQVRFDFTTIERRSEPTWS